MSILKTIQEISVVWVQNVNDFANPDVARLRVSRSWWQVSTPFTTGVIGCVVQTFFCIRYYLLSHNLYLVVPIVCFMILGISGISLTVYHILAEHDKAKVMWLLIHLIGVFIADFLITTGTFVELRRRSSGLERTTLLVNRLMRLVFESAIPPTLIASIDLIMTQTLGTMAGSEQLLFLGKIYVISLLYTLNSINEYRRENASDNHDIYTSDGHSGGISRRNNVELGNLSTKPDQILIQTEVSVSTHVSPIPGKSRAIEASAFHSQISLDLDRLAIQLKHHSSAIRGDFKAYSTD
ncbi:hypothetical protein C8R43DRAFT_1130549 [Mycena crocata]|nr:hypothetical protein C8R43DRAFT_1130549 [Mycena crocata]